MHAADDGALLGFFVGAKYVGIAFEIREALFPDQQIVQMAQIIETRFPLEVIAIADTVEHESEYFDIGHLIH